MSGTITLDKSVTIEPPFADAPLDQTGAAFSQAWARFFTNNADRIAELTQRVGVAEGDIASGGSGVTDGSDAPAGHIGEYLTATSGTVSLTSNVLTNIVSLNLTPGDWDVSGNVAFSTGSGNHLLFGAGIGGVLDSVIAASFPSSALDIGLTTAVHRFNVTVPTVVWLVAEVAETGSGTAQGTIRARRMR